ncbi:MAG: hypothetical protein WCN95_08420, partial [bacterium]
SGNYLALFDKQKEQLSLELQQIVNEVSSSKVPTPGAATGAAIRFAGDKPEYMRDGRLMMRVKELRRAGRDIPGFAHTSDFVWLVHAEIMKQHYELEQIFCVNANTGNVRTLFPDAPEGNPPGRR